MLIYFLAFIAIVFLLAWIYNRLVTLNKSLQEAFSDVDVQLKRRHDLIPKLVDVVKGYSQYEKNLLEQVTLARSQVVGLAQAKQITSSEEDLGRALHGFLAVAEAYPALKADGQYLDLMSSLSKTEDEIQMARRYYNGSVRNYNIFVSCFPANLVANFFNFKPADFFEIEYATDRAVPDVRFN